MRCYHCGGGLQKWKANDDPWVEHTKWFSNCDFIFLVKGEDFITEIKKTFLKKESDSEVMRQFRNRDQYVHFFTINSDVIRIRFVILMELCPHNISTTIFYKC